MAKKVYIDVIVDDKGTTKKVAVDAKQLGANLDRTAKGAHSADRALKGAAQASSNGTKNFSKMSQGITGGLIPAYATLAANVFAISAAFNFFREAADFEIMKKSQIDFAQSTGSAMQSVTAQLRQASGGMLGFQEAASAAAMGAAKGFTSSQLENLTIGARKASQALGVSFEDAFSRVIRGASKAEPELLDELGVTLKLEEATRRYGEAVGKNADDLTSYERSQAVLLETQRQLDEQFGGVALQENPFVKLQKTFDDIVKTVTGAVLPVFQTLAGFISKNATVAALAFAGLAISILKTIPGVSELGQKIMSLGEGSPLKDAIQEFKDFKSSIDDTRVSLEQVQEKAGKKFKGISGQMVQSGSSSKILAKVADGGTLTGADKANLNKALKAAEAQYKKHGKIVSGIFKGEDIKRVKHFKQSFKEMQKTSLGLGRKIKNLAGTTARSFKVVMAGIKQTGQAAFRGIGKAAGIAAKGIAAIGKASIVLGVIQAVVEAVQSLMKSPASLIKGFISGLVKIVDVFEFVANQAISVINSTTKLILKGVQGLFNGIIAGINSLIDSLPQAMLDFFGLDRAELKIGKVSFADDFKGIGALDLTSGLEESITNLVEGGLNLLGTSMEKLEDIEKAAKRTEALKERVEELREVYSQLAMDLPNITNGIKNQADEGKKAEQTFRAITEMDLAGKLRKAIAFDEAAVGAGNVPSAVEALKTELRGANLDGVVEGLQEAMDNALEGNFVDLDAITANAATAGGGLKEVQDSITNLNSSLSAGGYTAEKYLRNLIETANASDTSAEALKRAGVALETLDEAFGGEGAAQRTLQQLEFINSLKESNDLEAAGIALEKQKLAVTPNAAGEAKRLLAVRQANLAVRTQELVVERALLQVERAKTDKTINAAEAQAGLEKAQADLLALNEAADQARNNISGLGDVGRAVGGELEKGFSSAFQALVQGTQSAKEAFGNMAKSILSMIAKMITELMVAKLLTSALGGTGFGNFLGIAKPTARSGAITEPVPGYSTGGIARGREAGYPAILHGTEAVVPLPNGKEIPVQMRNGGGDNNVVVNVNMDGSSSQENSQGGDQRMKEMGRAISQAVQEELQKQKRPGGILSPYGAA